MTRIQDVHPTIVHSMGATVQILRNAIAYRQREIADMEAAIRACETVAADESQPRPELEPEELQKLDKKLENAVSAELTDYRPTGVNGHHVRTKLQAFRKAEKEGRSVDEHLGEEAAGADRASGS